MWIYKTDPKIPIIVVFALFLLNIFLGMYYRKEYQEVPKNLIGKWLGYSGDTITLSPNKLLHAMDEKNDLCIVEKVIAYKEGFIFANIFGNECIAVICNKKSTEKSQAYFKKMGLFAPQDYKLTYYFSALDGVEREIKFTQYMNKGYEGSEGIYIWSLGSFARLRVSN